MKEFNMEDFATEEVHDQEKFFSITKNKKRWIYRGQSTAKKNDNLKTGLERALDSFNIDLLQAVGIEKQMIRDFRRRYREGDRDLIDNDTLYCLSLMQHHGAPTRLLDFTYSPYIALYFCLEAYSKENSNVVWGINGQWCEEQCRDAVGKKKAILISKRNIDKKRNDQTFIPLYMSANKKDRRKFVYHENPLIINQRLSVQKGNFLCPGDISVSFEKNLKNLKDWNKENNIIKIKIEMNEQSRKETLLNLFEMNIDGESLFPGLDGFARSLKTRMPLFEKMAGRKVGTSPFSYL